MNRAASFFIFFLISLVYFVCTNGWYTPSVLIIKGKGEADSSFFIQWDSGAGFNRYEKRSFRFSEQLHSADQILDVSLKYTGKRGPATLKNDIYVGRISLDRQDVDLTQFASKKGGYNGAYGVKLNEHYREINFSAASKTGIELDLNTDVYSGIVEVSVGSVTERIDLYMPNTEAKEKTFHYWLMQPDGSFEVYVEIPRYDIETFQLQANRKKGPVRFDTALFVDSVSGDEQVVPIVQESDGQLVAFSNIRDRKYLNPVQFLQQIVFSLISAWIIMWAATALREAGGITKIFLGRRKVFWFFFSGAVVCYLFWLVAFWPGIMSVDSLKIWRAAILPELLLNDHPLINVFLYRYLSQVWTNPAIIPLFHIVAMGMLIAWIFYTIYHQGVSLRYLLPFYLLLILSIPVGLYNIVLWKDIPFAMLVTFWAFILADLFRKKRDGTLQLSSRDWILMLLLLLPLAFTRHNGMIYLAVVPIYVVMLGLFDARQVIKWSLAGIFLAGLALVVLMNSPVAADTSYLLSRISGSLHSLFNTSLSELLKHAFIDYWKILDVTQTDSKWDLWHLFLGDRTAYRFLVHAGWSDVYPYVTEPGPLLTKLQAFCLQLYQVSNQIPWVYVGWNPVYILALLPLTVISARNFPLSAIFSSFLLVQVFVLLCLINIMNWRYYYFVCLGGMFVGPLLLLDYQRKRKAG